MLDCDPLLLGVLLPAAGDPALSMPPAARAAASTDVNPARSPVAIRGLLPARLRCPSRGAVSARRGGVTTYR